MLFSEVCKVWLWAQRGLCVGTFLIGTGLAATSGFGQAVAAAEASSPASTQLNPGVVILMESADYTDSGACPSKTAIMQSVCDLQRDLQNVMGKTSEVVTSENSKLRGVPLIVVTHPGGKLTGYIDASLPANSEAHELKLMPGAAGGTSPQRMVLQGGSTRGTMYAIYQFSDEFLGVPPLYYWTGWLQSHAKLSSVPIKGGFAETIAAPAVKYRGIYPGDTDLLGSWLKESDTNYNAYFETYLRLKLNTMDVGSISDVPPHNANGGPSPNSSLRWAQTCSQRGLIVTFTHMSPFGADFSDWDHYWDWHLGGNNPAIGKNPPAITDIANMKQFWAYYLSLPAKYKITEVLQTLAFRGYNDMPWWLYVTGDPNKDSFSQYEATQIVNMLQMQLGMLQAANGKDAPARIIFYNEMQDFVAGRASGKYTFQIPDSTQDANLIWSFANTQRDQNPGPDVKAYSAANFPKNYATQLTGYYENPEFSNTGAHISSAEGPWKLEANQRFVMGKSAPGKYSVVIMNLGNFREFTVEVSAAAALLWSPKEYGNTNTYMTNFATRYFGGSQAKTIAGLFQQYYNAFWQSAPNDFAAGGYSPTGTQFPNEYPFQDGRYAEGALLLMGDIRDKCSAAPGKPCADQFLKKKGKVFRYNDGADYYNIVPAGTNHSSNQTAALIYGTAQARAAFDQVATSCLGLKNAAGVTGWPYLMDSLCTQAATMRELNTFMNALAVASTEVGGPSGAVHSQLVTAQTALRAWLSGPTDLAGRQQGPIFGDWYEVSKIKDFPYLQLDGKFSELLSEFPAQ